MAYSNNNHSNWSGGYAGEGAGYTTTTSYGAQGGNDGGGFMAGSQANASQQDNQDKYGKDTLRAVTILQVQTAEQTSGENFTIDGAEIGHVSVVGQIRAVTRQSIGINYTIDDGTASMEVRKYVGADRPTHDEDGNEIPEPPKEAALSVGSWAKVFGKPRQIGNNPKRSLNVHGIKPIVDKNEINHHLLEATYLHLLYTRGPPGGAGGAGAKQEEGLFVQGGGESGAELAGVGANAKKVFAWMKKQPTSNEGFHANTMSTELRIPFNNTMDAIQELHSVGVVYETVDPLTWNLL